MATKQQQAALDPLVNEAFMQYQAEVACLQAQLAAQQAVVEAAVGVLNCVSHGGQEAVWHHQADGACLDVLDKALTALDAAQAAQPEGEPR